MNADPKELEQKQEPEQTQAIAPRPPLDEVAAKTQGIIIGPNGLDFQDIAGLWRIAKMIHVAKLFPKGLESPEAICIAIAKGRSVGIIDPFQAVESIAVINGKACLYGDAPLAICRQNPHWQERGFEEYFEQGGERIEGNPATWTDETTSAVCITQRRHGKPRVTRFSVADAKRAKLWGKEGPWMMYPARMLMFRARGYNLRDNFGDSIKGLSIRELHEVDEERNITPPAGIEDLRQRIAAKKTRQDAPESIQPSNPPEPEPESQPTPESATKPPEKKDTPKRRNQSPAFIKAKMSLDLAVSNILKNEPKEIAEEELRRWSYDEQDGKFITLSDLEGGFGELAVYQRAASQAELAQ